MLFKCYGKLNKCVASLMVRELYWTSARRKRGTPRVRYLPWACKLIQVYRCTIVLAFYLLVAYSRLDVAV